MKRDDVPSPPVISISTSSPFLVQKNMSARGCVVGRPSLSFAKKNSVTSHEVQVVRVSFHHREKAARHELITLDLK